MSSTSTSAQTDTTGVAVMRSARTRRQYSQWALPAITIAAIVVFSFLRPDTFATLGNARAIALTQTILVIVALAELFVLITGDFDLSVGGNLALGGILTAGLPSLQGLPVGLSILLAILACGIVGLINGILVNVVRINAFITTLSTGLILAGIATWYTNGQVIYENIPKALPEFGAGDFLGIPNPVWLIVVLMLIVYYVLDHTPFGRFLYAIGGSREASRLSGLNVRGLSISAFTISGILCGIAGVTATSVLGTGNPTVGPAYLLPAFAAVFLGATSFKPGRFNVFGTVLAVFAIAIGVTGLQAVGVPYFVEPVFNGLVLLTAVAASRRLRADAA
ncbi:ABC transporter permease [Leucobacter soli]|uniref:Ribose import permease protein RbsC n=1 Tax=Leucobacter soli TaxID=2812850 RepID=A0A916K064_9MICO|nr:ABC transporter permease [Leucobacter soli]CAG7619486.1 Ribose import permease protein RbsC [Leucobacter soli]